MLPYFKSKLSASFSRNKTLKNVKKTKVTLLKFDKISNRKYFCDVRFVYETRSQAMMSSSLFGAVGLAKRAAIFRSFRYKFTLTIR